MRVRLGFTLMELMVALAISSAVVLSAYAYYGRNVLAFNAMAASYLDELDEFIELVRDSQRGVRHPSSGQKRRAYRLVRPN